MLPVEQNASVMVQPGFWGERVPQPSFADFPVGTPASDVWRRIVSLHPEITGFSYIAYSPQSTYKDALSQDISWHPWNRSVDLQAISEGITRKSLFEMEFEGDNLRIYDILALASSVKTADGTVMQIPMLDFESELSPENQERIQSLGLPRGVLLESGRSYHYYGFRLMTQGEWTQWITRLKKAAGQKDLFGDDDLLFQETYLNICLNRGYTALRVFGYGDTDKPVTPKVRAYIPEP